jgi:ATP-binding cassette subfamily F protein 2
MVAQGLTEKVINDKTVHFYFPSCGSIPPPVIMVQVRDAVIQIA